ncbi:hypothetical protein, conserved [Babesia ovata]|uniref:C3H1-type domain-containing protein n=1 Tax=Babesia ovata TaxID=189622 RepID=A0A2H6KKG2_9APIC|nr:uncharacterized protein BOVATA_049600 [Babesia ovata]GBE63467.1 hypothetical protein, conserved [Babesia ovata]
MSFLHGVLSGVKDDDNVITYNNYIKLNSQDDLHTVLQHLQSSIGSGRVGLSASVTKVREWLGKYNEEVGKKTKAVTGGLSTLIGKLSVQSQSVSGDYYKEVAGRSGLELQEQLRKWKETLHDIDTHFNNDITTNVNMLDSTLRDKIKNETRPIKAAVRMLQEATVEKGFVAQVKAVDMDLIAQRDRVISNITDECSALQARLEKAFWQLFRDVDTMYKAKNDNISFVRKAIQDAKKNVEKYYKSFDEEYKNKILGMFDELKLKMAQINATNRHVGGDENESMLKKQVNQIKTELLAVGTQLDQHVSNLERRTREAEWIKGEAVKKAQGVYNELMKEAGDKESIRGKLDGIDKAQSAIENLNDTLGRSITELLNWKDAALMVVDAAKAMCDSVIKDLKCNEVNNEFNKKLTEISVKAGELYQFYEATKERLEKVVRESKAASDRLKLIKDDVKSRLNSNVTKALQQLKEDLKKHQNVMKLRQEIQKLNGDANICLNAGSFAADKHIKIEDINVDKVIKPWLEKVDLNGPLITAFNDGVQSLDGAIQREKTVQVLGNATDTITVPDVNNVTQHGNEIGTAVAGMRRRLGEVSEMVENKRDDKNTIKRVLEDMTSIITHNKNGDVELKAKYSFPMAELNVKGLARMQDVLQRENGKLPTHTGTIHSAVQAIKARLTTLQGELQNGAVPNPKGTGILDKLKALETTIGSGDRQDGDDSIGQLNYKITKLQKEQITSDTSKIHKTMEGVLSVITELEGLPGDVEEKRGEVKRLMEKLNGELYLLKGNINYIDGEVDKADRALIDAMNALFQSLEAARNTLKDSINALKENLMDATRGAFQCVINDVRSLFTNQKLADLSALHKLVERQAKKIANIIFSDTTNGLKGFLNTLSGHLETYIDPFRYPDVKQFSQAFQTYFTPIYEYTKYQLLPDTKPPTTATPVPPPISGGGYRARPATATMKEISEIANPPGRAGMGNTSQSPNPSPPTSQPSPSPSAKNPIEKFFEDLNVHTLGLFTVMHEGKLGHKASSRCDLFTNFLDTMRPTKFAEHDSPLLDVLKSGLQDFLGEIGKAYVNTYEGHPYKVDFSREADGKNCAKAFLTLLNTLQDDLTTLKQRCDHPSPKSKIDLSTGLGELFESYGYVVSKRDKQNGELRNHDDRKGQYIHDTLLETPIKGVDKITSHLKICISKENNINLFDILKCLTSHVTTFNEVCHLGTFSAKRSPCSVYEMLAWCYGLQYNGAYNKMKLHYQAFLKKQQEKEEKERSEGKTNETDNKKDIYLRGVMGKLAKHGLPELSRNSRNILTTVLGHGDEDTMYASDFANNKLNLKYPNSGEECLHTLLDILRKLFPPLRYLQTRCQIKTKHSGWRECKYGKNIPTTKSQCSDYVSGKANCQPRCEPNCQATRRPTDEPNCQPTSPLMSYLNDCLPGHLPHQLSSVGCASVCLTCPKAVKGMPCLTPLGFRSFSGSTRTGRDICKILSTFFDDAELRSVLCLVAKPPSTLPEHFGFALSLANDWHNARHSIKDSLEKSINDRSISLYENPSKFTNALRDIFNSKHNTHPDKNHLTQYADLSSLTIATPCNVADVHCAPYLYTLCTDQYSNLATTHSDAYLSWAVYLPWTFWNYLECLYNAFKEIFCQDWGCRTCLHGKCKRGQHGLSDEESKQPHCQCGSMVQCKGVSSTLYQCGFTFGDALTLNDEKSPKQCSDFCTQLRNILDSEYFKDLFEECDNFLKEIRWPFMLTLLALWSLSLLYLLHITVVRLDVLRIRSHLRSPSSHRIAAQSLLAAARDAREKALDDIDARRISLGQLAGQLSGLIGGGKEVTEAISAAITCVKEQIKKCEECQELSKNRTESLKDPQSCHCPEHEKINDLQKKQEKIAQQLDNPATTLLNNLCTGLEKFLGHSNGNYTGTGIVYSDLDRLCDGVMSFLHGVLESVKDDESVKHYFSTDKMDKVLQEIKTSMHQKGALREWEEKVKKHTSTFTTTLDHLKDNNFDYINKSLKKLNDVYGDSLRNVPALLQTCFDEAKHLHDVFKLTETYYMDLDPTLKDKLKVLFDYINLQVKEFAAAAQNTELKQLLVFSEERAKLLEKTVNDKVKYRTNQLGSDINDAFERQIGKPIDDVKEKLTAVHADLGKWIVAAEKFIQMIHNQVDDIINEVMSSAANPCGISTAAGKLKEDAVKLYTEMQEAHGYIAERVQSALGVVDAALKTAVMSDLKQLRDKIKQTVGEHIRYASSFENKLKDAIETMVTSMVNEKGGAVDTYVGKYVIDKGNSSLLNGKENDIKAAILHYLPDIIKQLVEESAGKAGLSSTAEFSQIGSSLQDFAKRFGKQIKSELSGKTKLEEIAEQIAEEIKNFLEASKISNLAQAIESVKTLGEKLENAVTRAVVPSTGAFKERLKAQAEGLIGTEYGNGSGDFKTAMDLRRLTTLRNFRSLSL